MKIKQVQDSIFTENGNIKNPRINKKITYSPKTFWSGFLSGVLSSIIGSMIYNWLITYFQQTSN